MSISKNPLPRPKYGHRCVLIVNEARALAAQLTHRHMVMLEQILSPIAHGPLHHHAVRQRLRFVNSGCHRAQALEDAPLIG